MSNLIFVPELGLISGKSQNLRSRLWFPQASSNRLQQRQSSKSKKPARPSPFTQTQQLIPLRTRTKSPKSHKKPENRPNLTALEVSMQPRPTTSSVTHKKRTNRDPVHSDQVFFNSSLEVSLQSRPMTMAGLRKKQSLDCEAEGFAYLPTLNSRPTGTAKFNCE